jgi:hypothetical protein
MAGLKLLVFGVDKQRLWLSGFTGQFAASFIDHYDPLEAFQILSDPAKTTFFIGMRVINPGYLLRRRKEVLMDERVVIGEKDAKAGVRVIPADDPRLRIVSIFDAVNVLPRILGKRDMGASLEGIRALDAGLHRCHTAIL